MAASNDYWSQFPIHSDSTPPLPPAATADLTKAPWTVQPDPSLISNQPGGDFGMLPPGMKFPNQPGTDPYGNKIPQYGDPGFDPQNPPPWWRPSVDPGGYIPTQSQQDAENKYFQSLMPSGGSPVMPSATILPYSGGVGYSNQTGQVSNQPFNLGSLGTNTGITGGMNLSATQVPSPYATQSLGAPPSNLGMVHMQAPDGTIEPVDPAHVAHYQSLGATLVNPQQMAGNQVTGQQLTGSGYANG